MGWGGVGAVGETHRRCCQAGVGAPSTIDVDAEGRGCTRARKAWQEGGGWHVAHVRIILTLHCSPAVFEGLLNAKGLPDPTTRELTPEQKKRR